jgi:membrane protease YdiL (CAAX protease family)
MVADSDEQLARAAVEPEGPGRKRNPLPAPTRPRRTLAVELALLFLLAFAPALLGLAVVATGATQAAPPASEGTVAEAAANMAFVVVVTWIPVAVLGFLLVRHREGFRAIGLTRPGLRDLGATAMLWPGSFAVVLLLDPIFSQLGTNDVEFLELSLPLWWLIAQALLISLTAGITEEILVRGYAQTRLEQFRLPQAVVVLVPTAFWAVLHAYQGLGAAFTIFGLGLLYAAYFHRTRRLWPVIAAHTLFDLTVLSLLITQR